MRRWSPSLEAHEKKPKLKNPVGDAGGLHNISLQQHDFQKAAKLGRHAEIESCNNEDCAQDVVQSLLVLIDQHEGKFPCSALPKLYKQNPNFEKVVDVYGGPKKFCSKHIELEMLTPGWIQRRAKEVSAQDVVNALLVLIDKHGGKFPGSQLPKLYQQSPKFKSIVDSDGGAKKFCSKHVELEMITEFGPPGWIERRVQEVCSQDVVDALLVLIDDHEGKLPGNQLPQLYQQNPKFMDIVDGWGGPKRFCLKHSQIEMVTNFGGCGWIQQRVEEVSVQDVVDALLVLVDEHDGKFPGSQLPKFYQQNPKFRGIVDRMGGPKKLCSVRTELEMVTKFGGCGWIQRRAEEFSSQDVVDALLALIDAHGGKLAGSQLPQLYSQHLKMKKIIDASGGLKKFCLEHNELEFITEFQGPGWIQRRHDQVSAQDVVDAMLVQVDNSGGKLLGSQVPKQIGLNPAFKSIIDDAGGPKMFCMCHRELEFMTAPGGHGFIQRRLVHDSIQDVVDALLTLSDEYDGRFPVSSLAELYEQSSEFKEIIKHAGGIEGFCSEHGELEFVGAKFGRGFIRRCAEEVSVKAARDSIPHSLQTSEVDQGAGQRAQVMAFKALIMHSNQEPKLNSYGLPLRPGQAACDHYMKTWRCKYGTACKWDHPESLRRCSEEGSVTGGQDSVGHIVQTSRFDYGAADRAQEMPLEAEIPEGTQHPQLNSYGLPLRPGRSACDYYMRTWTCKYGTACKWDHPEASESKHVVGQGAGVKSSKEDPMRNSLGMPLRPGMQPCPYYMRTQKCGYGARCRWDHPERKLEQGAIELKSVRTRSTMMAEGAPHEASVRHEKVNSLLANPTGSAPSSLIRGFSLLAESDSESEADQAPASRNDVWDGTFEELAHASVHHRDIAEPIAQLRYCFPMYDDEFISHCYLNAHEDLEKAVYTLSASLSSLLTIEIEPAQIAGEPERRERRGVHHTITGHVISRTDHPKQPLFCFIVLVAESDSEKCRVGTIVRPIPEDRFRIRLDESGHFWLKKQHVPEVGSFVEMKFFEEVTEEYLNSGHGKYPHQNEDLLCTSLRLRAKCDLSQNAVVRERLMELVCNDISERWTWRSGLKKFQSVNTDKYIWYVPAWKQKLPSVVILRSNLQREVSFSYRNATSNKMSISFTVGNRRLTDIPITAAGFDELPMALNKKFASTRCENQFFVLGLARAERRGPAGCNRLNECEGKALSLLEADEFEAYCQIMLVGVLDLGAHDGATSVSPQ